MQPECSDCLFWLKNDLADLNAYKGTCRWRPPAETGCWVQTDHDDWCGQSQPKPKVNQDCSDCGVHAGFAHSTNCIVRPPTCEHRVGAANIGAYKYCPDCGELL